MFAISKIKHPVCEGRESPYFIGCNSCALDDLEFFWGGFAFVCLIQALACSHLSPFLACRMLKIDYKMGICVYLICLFCDGHDIPLSTQT